MSKKWLTFFVIAAIVFIVATFAIFFYLDISEGNNWSTFFSFTSTFGIIATIGVYLLQKHHNKKNERKIRNAYLNAINDEINNINNIKDKISEIKQTIKDREIEEFYIRNKFDFYTFVFKINDEKKPIKVIIKWDDVIKSRIHELRQNSINVDINLYLSSTKLVNSVDNFHRRINHVFLKYNKKSPRKNIITKPDMKDMMNCFLFTKNDSYLDELKIK